MRLFRLQMEGFVDVVFLWIKPIILTIYQPKISRYIPLVVHSVFWLLQSILFSICLKYELYRWMECSLIWCVGAQALRLFRLQTIHSHRRTSLAIPFWLEHIHLYLLDGLKPCNKFPFFQVPFSRPIVCIFGGAKCLCDKLTKFNNRMAWQPNFAAITQWSFILFCRIL